MLNRRIEMRKGNRLICVIQNVLDNQIKRKTKKNQFKIQNDVTETTF